MVARIYRPARNAMQSGKGKSESWLLEFESDAPRTTDPLMGWTSSGDTRQQLKLSFRHQGTGHCLCRRRMAWPTSWHPNLRCVCIRSPILIISNGAGPTTGPTE